MAKPIKVVINNSNLNSFGFRVLTEGIDFSQFEKNPILLYMHIRADEAYRIGGKNPVLGNVINIKVEGDNLVGELKFSESNSFAQEIQALYEEDTLRMVSPGLKPIEWSDDPAVLLPGQTGFTLIKSKLRELSCADIGSNDDALKFYDDNDKVIELKGGGTNLFPALKEDKIDNKKEVSMKNVLGTLNLTEGTEESIAVDEIKKLQLRAAKADELEAQIANEKNARVISLVDQAVKEEKITADKKEIFLSIGKNSGIEALEATFGAMQPAVRATDIIGGKNPATEKTADVGTKLAEMSWDELDKAEKLVELKEKDFELFKLKYKGEFGVEYKELKTK